MKSYLVAFFCLAAIVAAASPTSRAIAKQARKAEKSGRIAEAYLLYSQLAAIDPKHGEAWGKSQALRTRAMNELAAAGRLSVPGAEPKDNQQLLAQASPPPPPPAQDQQPPQTDPPKPAGPPSIPGLFSPGARPAGLPIPFPGMPAQGPAQAPAPVPVPIAAQPPAPPPESTETPKIEIVAGVDKEITAEDMVDAKKLAPPPELAAKSGKVSHNLTGPPRTIFERVAQAYGLQVIFDTEYPPSGNPVKFRLDDVDYREALHALEDMTMSFIVPIDSKRFIVAKDTQPKRQALEPTVALLFSIPEPVSVQEAQELARSIQQAMEIQKFAIDNSRRVVLLRDRLSKVRPAQQIFMEMATHRPMVSIELELLSFARTKALSYGITLPTSAPITWLANGTQALSKLGISSGVLGITIASASAMATLSESIGTSLLRTDIRGVSGLPSQMHIGYRYPILSSGYYGTVTGNTGDGTVYRPPPAVSFEDLGITIKVTPFVHNSEEMTLDVESEFKVLTGASANGIPVIANRKFTSRVRLRNDEWAVMAGLTNVNESKTLGGIAGIAGIPILGTALSKTTTNYDDNETLLLIKPHLLSLPPSEFITNIVAVGTESRLRSYF